MGGHRQVVQAAILIHPAASPLAHEVQYAGAVPLPDPLGICAKIHVD